MLAVAGQPAQQLEDRVPAVADPLGVRRLRRLPQCGDRLVEQLPQLAVVAAEAVDRVWRAGG